MQYAGATRYVVYLINVTVFSLTAVLRLLLGGMRSNFDEKR